MSTLVRLSILCVALISTISNAADNFTSPGYRPLQTGNLNQYDFRELSSGDVKDKIKKLKRRIRARKGWLTANKQLVDYEQKKREYILLLRVSKRDLEYQLRLLTTQSVSFDSAEDASSEYSTTESDLEATCSVSYKSVVSASVGTRQSANSSIRRAKVCTYIGCAQLYVSPSEWSEHQQQHEAELNTYYAKKSVYSERAQAKKRQNSYK